MAPWKPESGETLLARDSIVFATGTAQAVSGMRWFRDMQRNDIQQQLEGWPAGPSFTARPQAQRCPVRRAGLFGLRALYALTAGALEGLGGTGSFFPGAGGGPGHAQDPPNEIEDFPVIRGDSGSIAQGLPWQLDPGRCPGGYRTHAVVTDRRVVITGFPDGDPSQDEVLWDIERTAIKNVERMRYSNVGEEAKICFADGSWCRLAPPSPRMHWAVLRHLAHPTDLVPIEILTARQRRYVQSYIDSVTDRDSALRPVITRRPSGKILIEITTTEPIKPDVGIFKPYSLMSEAGRRGGFDPGDV